MIHRSHRFHGFGSLDRLYRHGLTVRSQFLALKWQTNPKTTSYRAAVVVSKKVAKSAPTRNRIRRRVYEILRSFDIQPQTDLVITIFDERLSTLPHDELASSLEELFQKAKLVTQR